MLALIAIVLTAGFLTPIYAQDEVQEHPGIKAMTGGTLSPGSAFLEFRRLPLNFRQGDRLEQTFVVAGAGFTFCRLYQESYKPYDSMSCQISSK